MATMIETMHMIDSCMAVNPFYAMLTLAASKAFVKKGYAIVNEDITNEDSQFATRLTDAGYAFLNSTSDTNEVSNPAKAPKMNVSQFAIETCPIPVSKRKPGQGRPSKYPFDALEVGQMFFVPASEDQPEPEKTLGSVVAAANRRYATVSDETKLNRKGEMVPKLNYTRKFVTRAIERGGVSGAGVWREK